MTKIVRSFGGSALTVKSGGVLNVESGASMALVYPAADNGTLVRFTNGTNDAPIGFGTGVPTYSTSPGAVYFRSGGSFAGIYINVSTGTAGSVWASASLNRP